MRAPIRNRMAAVTFFMVSLTLLFLGLVGSAGADDKWGSNLR